METEEAGGTVGTVGTVAGEETVPVMMMMQLNPFLSPLSHHHHLKKKKKKKKKDLS